MIQLETNPEDPYSVNIAYTVVDDQLYIYAGDTRTQWVENMEADPRVRFRLDDTIYELRAERVTDRNKIS
ncbi:MAG: nitroreductase family deazaflavin-dependent oxidoreductase, partial [bacterium]|nr:nitroreductase family deazaflavin-dependent oxidoreductase [bacterium]